MADTFFGFDTTLNDNNLEEGLECPLEEDDLGEEEEYDALNDETFGSEATIGDWEKDHEKLAQITESSRPQNQNVANKKVLRNGVSVDIEDNLSHLVLDEKEGIVPRPGVWDSPTNLPLSKSQPVQSLPTAFKNVCTVEELERGLIANRPPPGLSKPTLPQQQQQQQKADGSILFEALALNEKLQINGLPPTPRFPPQGLGIPNPHPVLMPPNIRLPHPQFLQSARLLANQGGNLLRYSLPPHLMLPHAAQRQPLHNVFAGNFPQAAHSNLGPPPFLRAEHGMIPSFPRDQSNYHQHGFQHSGNQRHQSRFHHNEPPAIHQPFFKHNHYLHHLHNRNNQRHYSYQHPPHVMNGTNGSGEYDEYAGLMSNREKQWLINIQLLQLNTNQPYIDDYYYTVFSDRQNKKNDNPERRISRDKAQQNNNGYHRDSRDKDQPQHVLTKVVYTPLQFENSLGKLQCGSVTAPRKIIDMDVVPNSESQSTSVMQQKDTKKTRQLLLEIERLYTIQLKLEDLDNPLAILNEQQQQQQEADNEKGVMKKSATELINSIYTSLSQLIQDDKFAGMLCIRKGKMLLLRFLPRVNVKEYSEQLTDLWVSILRGLAVIGRRDAHLIPNFYPEFRSWLETITNFAVLLRLARALTECIGLPNKNNSLVFALSNKFGVSAITNMIAHAERLYPLEESWAEEWSTFILAVVQIVEDSLPDIEPYDPIAACTLEHHLERISGLKAGSDKLENWIDKIGKYRIHDIMRYEKPV